MASYWKNEKYNRNNDQLSPIKKPWNINYSDDVIDFEVDFGNEASLFFFVVIRVLKANAQIGKQAIQIYRHYSKTIHM